jgi:hypothetical protein
MNRGIRQCWVVFAAAALLGAGSAARPTLDEAMAKLENELKGRDTSEGTRAFDILVAYGDAGGDALCEFYDRPDAGPFRRQILHYMEALNAQTAKVRGLMLRVAREEPMDLRVYAVTYLAKHCEAYAVAEQVEICGICRRVVNDLPFALEFWEFMTVPVLDVLGRHGAAADIGAIQGVLKNPQVSGKAGLVRGCRRAMAKLGDGDSVKDILNALNAQDGETAGGAVCDLEYIDDPRHLPRLLGLLKDKRIGEKVQNGGNMFDRTTGAAVDYMAARAIFNLSRTKPVWPLTAPDGKLLAKGVHPDNASDHFSSKHFDTLSNAQRDEVVAWAKGFEGK